MHQREVPTGQLAATINKARDIRFVQAPLNQIMCGLKAGAKFNPDVIDAVERIAFEGNSTEARGAMLQLARGTASRILAHLGEQGFAIAEKYANDLSPLARLRAVEVLVQMALFERNQPTAEGLSARAYNRALQIRETVKDAKLSTNQASITMGKNFVSIDDGAGGRERAEIVDAMLTAYAPAA